MAAVYLFTLLFAEHVGWASLSTCRLNHQPILVYKAICLFPSYLLIFISQRSSGSYCFHPQDVLSLSIPRVTTKLGKKAFRFAAPFAWNKLQKDLELHD